MYGWHLQTQIQPTLEISISKLENTAENKSTKPQ
jgi:hypothetical protein